MIVKHNSHNNDLIVLRGVNCYYKYSIGKEGDDALKREIEGYKWFGIQVEEGKDYIVIPEFRGKGFEQYNGITRNEEWIKKLICFYEEKFYKAEKFAIHGDFALCNVIFGEKEKEKEVYLVDWEHFHYASRDYYGFDIINMLFILLEYEYRRMALSARIGINWIPFVKHKTCMFIRHCWKMLGDSGYLRQPFTNTAWYINKYMDKKKFILGRQIPEILESLDLICQI